MLLKDESFPKFILDKEEFISFRESFLNSLVLFSFNLLFSSSIDFELKISEITSKFVFNL